MPAAVEPGDLLEAVRNERKAAYLCAAIRAFAEVDEAFLYDGPIGEVRAFLRAIPGIGPWSENFIALRGLGRMEYCNPSEALFDAARERYAEPVSERRLAERAATYGNTIGHRAFYLRAVPALRPLCSSSCS